jgi:hypothetical protein
VDVVDDVALLSEFSLQAMHAERGSLEFVHEDPH